MRCSSPERDAAIRAIQGESDVRNVMPAITDWHLAPIIAFASHTHPVVRALAALFSGLPSLIDHRTVADPDVHSAILHLITTNERWNTVWIWRWAEIAPAGWGRAHTAELINAVKNDTCPAGAAAALIGPCDEAAMLLGGASDAAFAMGRWGRSDPANPIAWFNAIAPQARSNLLCKALHDSYAVASCLPWMPPEEACRIQLDDSAVHIALTAFADADVTAHELHAPLVQRLVAISRPHHLDALTRLACAWNITSVWQRVHTRIMQSPEDVWRVVIAAPWDDLAEDVHDAILTRCSAVAAARGRRDCTTTPVDQRNAIAFFAALNPKVWDKLNAATQHAWLSHLPNNEAYLAVRSLGLRPEILVRARFGDILNHRRALTCVVQRHAHGDESALRSALFPIALRSVDPDRAHALIAALPTIPSDPGAFFCIAGEKSDPSIMMRARTTLRTPANMALAVALQRILTNEYAAPTMGALLQHVLHGSTWSALEEIRPLLENDISIALMPDADAIIERLAHPDHRDAMRATLARLENLPLEVALPTFIVLQQATQWNMSDSADALAHALQTHGDVFVALADTLTDPWRHALLPTLSSPRQDAPLRALTLDNPVCGRRLAYALRNKRRRDALHQLLAAPPHHADAVWRTLPEEERHAIHMAIPSTTQGNGDMPSLDAIGMLALKAAIQSDDVDLQNAGIAALEMHTAAVRAIWNRLPQEAQQFLRKRSAFADLGSKPNRIVVRRRRDR